MRGTAVWLVTAGKMRGQAPCGLEAAPPPCGGACQCLRCLTRQCSIASSATAVRVAPTLRFCLRFARREMILYPWRAFPYLFGPPPLLPATTACCHPPQVSLESAGLTCFLDVDNLGQGKFSDELVAHLRGFVQCVKKEALLRAWVRDSALSALPCGTRSGLQRPRHRPCVEPRLHGPLPG